MDVFDRFGVDADSEGKRVRPVDVCVVDACTWVGRVGGAYALSCTVPHSLGR